MRGRFHWSGTETVDALSRRSQPQTPRSSFNLSLFTLVPTLIFLRGFLLVILYWRFGKAYAPLASQGPAPLVMLITLALRRCRFRAYDLQECTRPNSGAPFGPPPVGGALGEYLTALQGSALISIRYKLYLFFYLFLCAAIFLSPSLSSLR